jgi:1-acyl-sn-glycerol-3-phosphate acyltransferase
MGKTKKSGSALYRIFYAIFAGVIGFVFNVRVIGRENEPDRSGFMVCANHTSATDPVVLCYAFRKHQVHFMAKKELFKVPVVNWLVSLMGAFPVDRGGGDVGAIKKSVAMLKEGRSMGIFPQGHRYPEVDPRTTQTKNGAALICTKAEADIVPVYIARKNNTHKLFRRTWVIIGEPIPYAELAYDRDASGEYARITDLVFDRICTLGENFSEEEAKKRVKKTQAEK